MIAREYNKIISEIESYKFDNSIINSYTSRHIFTSNMSWSIPNNDTIELLCDFIEKGNVISIGSGLGLWEKLIELKSKIKNYNINIITTDDLSWYPDKKLIIYKNIHNFKLCLKAESDKKNTNIKKLWKMPINLNHQDAIKKYGHYDTLLLSWPPYDDNMAYETIKLFKGYKIIYIGEPIGGCCGNDEFFDILEKEWMLIKEIKIPQWEGIHDSIFVYERISSLIK